MGSKNHPPKQPNKPLHQQALDTLQTQFSNLINRMKIPQFSSLSSSIFFDKIWRSNQTLSHSEIKKRMSGIPIYKLSSYSGDNVCLVSHHGEREIQFYFFSKADAQDYCDTTKLAHGLNDLRILDTPLNDAVHLEGDGVPIRLVPESLQVKNAIEERKKNMASDEFLNENFSGIPVFQSDYLSLWDHRTTKKYRLAYFRKEDLENAIVRLNLPENSEREKIEVSSLEEIIREMKDNTTSKSNDVVFVGAGITSWTWFLQHQLS